ncbi:NAD(P)/FAD-dependent oxidoreductase [Aquibium sp. ELW1220]|jgi:thioredoxin reductase|uniref:NAD(P)/FAD-dependent oxidoreductase n=1 Tax=Aquibium sp. ELW1220 TaxID=2976766 RepID=UPI0025B0FE28|nr:NAD(P)/FAD-dependent oxidoreductase [Aquibium sp. ELW1220]MDN2581458.1 NAD(P)/FAD-dependent oxidoreductase [Aquibium sp. ELW1220]
MFDVIVIGGSYAGLSAAIQVARARRRVLVIDAGNRRNRYSSTSHGFLGRDGHTPGAIAAEAREQLLAYPSVSFISGQASSATGGIDAFNVAIANGQHVEGRRIVLATGVEDVLPDVPGLASQWGVGAMACPYCHGYELNRGRIGVLATGPASLHQAAMLPEWGQTTLFANGVFEPGETQFADLVQRGVSIESMPVTRIDGDPGAPVVVLSDGQRIEIDGLFVATRTRIATPLPAMLGCRMEDGPQGSFVATDAMKATSVPGVFACGDVASPMASVAIAVGHGAMAGAAVHRSLIFPPQISKAA